MEQSTTGKRHIKHSLYRIEQKIVVNFVHKQKSYRGSCWPTHSQLR